MSASSADIEAMLIDGNVPDDPTPSQLPAIFRDIVSGRDAGGYAYAALGHLALALHE